MSLDVWVLANIIQLGMRLSDLIDGWIIALQQMSVGDRWEV